MKFWVKIIVAVCVVGVVAFGVWAFFFREKDEVVAYNRTCELIEYKESSETKDKLNDLKTFDYLGNDSTNTIPDNNDTNCEIIKLREIMLSDKIVKTYDEGGNVTCTFDSYMVMEDYMDSMICKLIPYIKNSKAKGSLNSNLKNSINNYIKHIKELNQTIDILVDCQESITGTEVEMTVLLGNYNSLRIKYRRCLNDSANVIGYMFDIIKATYGEIKFDTSLSLLDGYARSVKVSSNEDKLKEEEFFAHDAHLILDKYIKVEDGENIFNTEYNEYDYLMNYNKLFDKYASEFEKALNKHNLNKVKMADGDELSDIKVEAQESLIYVLNVFGF